MGTELTFSGAERLRLFRLLSGSRQDLAYCLAARRGGGRRTGVGAHGFARPLLAGRPITAVEVGNRSGRRVLAVGCLRVNEPGGIPIARALERVSPHDLDLWIVPDLNPDGVAADTRQNAHGVDLNRNFPWHWRPLLGSTTPARTPCRDHEGDTR
jgi:predicted deacylase